MSHFTVILYDFPEPLSSQTIAVDVYEQRDLSLMTYHMRARIFYVKIYRRLSRVSYRYNSLVPSTAATDKVHLKIYVTYVKVDKL
jgi:hypothetical protein